MKIILRSFKHCSRRRRREGYAQYTQRRRRGSQTESTDSRVYATITNCAMLNDAMSSTRSFTPTLSPITVSHLARRKPILQRRRVGLKNDKFVQQHISLVTLRARLTKAGGDKVEHTVLCDCKRHLQSWTRPTRIPPAKIKQSTRIDGRRPPLLKR